MVSVSCDISLNRERSPRLLRLFIDACQIIADSGDVTHLAVDPGLALAIEMHKYLIVVIVMQPLGLGRPVARAQHIDHDGRGVAHIRGAEGEVGNGSQVLLEL